MTNTAPTPGIWRLNGTQIISLHADEEGEHETLIAELFDQHEWWKANACLIASAPKLFSALQYFFNIMHDYESSRRKGYVKHAFQLAREAIAEAKGGRP